MDGYKEATFVGKIDGRDCHMKISPHAAQIKFDDNDILVNPQATITQLFEILTKGKL